jgi:manganese/zinc/iron transport system permease protein
MAAMLVTPAAAARYWTDRLPVMVALAAGIGALSGLLGTWISVLAPRMPTGPWTVVAASTLFLISLLAAPRRGLLGRWMRHRRMRRRTADENTLKALFQLGESSGDHDRPRAAAAIAARRGWNPRELSGTLGRLEKAGFVAGEPEGLRLTQAGLERARRVVRLHRLWEVYLTERLHLAADHVHEDAEHIEHILTPELEAELEAILARPALDPHLKPIPYELPLPAERPRGSREAGAAES